MACPSVCGDIPRALASGLSYVQVDKHDTCISIVYHLQEPFHEFSFQITILVS